MKLGFLGWIVAILVFSVCMAFSQNVGNTYMLPEYSHSGNMLPTGATNYTVLRVDVGDVVVHNDTASVWNTGFVVSGNGHGVNGWGGGTVLFFNGTVTIPVGGTYVINTTGNPTLTVLRSPWVSGASLPSPGLVRVLLQVNNVDIDQCFLSVPVTGTFTKNAALAETSAPTIPGVAVHVYLSGVPSDREGVVSLPTTGEGALTLDNADSATVGLWVDLDGDGVLERVTAFEAEGGNFNFTVDPAWYGKDYGLHVEALTVDGKTVPYSKTLQTGTFTEGSNVSVGGSVQVEVQPGVGTVSIGPNGGAPQLGQVQVNTISSGSETKTSYTYANSTGGQTSVVYSDPGTDPVKASDLRQASAQASADAEKIVAAIKEGPGDVNVGTAPTYDAKPALPSALDTTKGDEALSKASEGYDAANSIVTGLQNGLGPAPGMDTGYGQTLTWQITLPVLGTTTIDLSAHSEIINAFRAFLKFLLGIIAWIVSIKTLRGAFA